jgi:hypothetical protein
MNTLITLLNTLNYRSFFYFVIPILTPIIWTLKHSEIFVDNFLNGTAIMILQILGIYFIGGCWLLIYAAYKAVVVGNSKKVDLHMITSSEHLNFDNYRKAVFYTWIVAFVNIIIEIY